MLDYISIFFATYAIALPPIVLAVLYLRSASNEKVSRAIFALGVAALSFVLAKIASFFFFNPRPFVVGDFAPLVAHAANNGFPSEHSLLAGVLASIALAWSRRAGIALWLLAAAIGAARVYAGVHHAIDILASFAIAAIATYAISLAIARWKR